MDTNLTLKQNFYIMNDKSFKKGTLLIADPNIFGDVFFNRSIILLVECNDENEIVGFILNKKLKYKLNDIISDIKINFDIYNGGPVNQDNLYFIHNTPDLISNSVKVSNNLYWSGNIVDAISLLNLRKIDKRNIKFFLGYSGWDRNLLEKELLEKSWIISKKTSKDIISGNLKTMWREKMIEFGGDYKYWSNSPADPTLN